MLPSLRDGTLGRPMSDTSRRNFFEHGATALVGITAAGESGVGQTSAAPLPLEGHMSSAAVHAGEDGDCSAYPVYQGSNNHGVYSRNSNPTIDSVEVKIAELEGADQGVATACGMAAISTTLLSLVQNKPVRSLSRPSCFMLKVS